jgi:ABC-type lipoprotein release transport system permease subunit
MMIFRLAWRNAVGAGLRTWLNATVLSFAFVAIIWTQGLYQGMNAQVEDTMIATVYGSGQYWHKDYDPFDPLSLPDAHGRIPGVLSELARSRQAVPILMTQGSIYPEGRMQPVLLKGIDPRQKALTLPSDALATGGKELPVLIGTRMAGTTGLKKGDFITVQWRDVHGTFDAREARIVSVMKTTVPDIDVGSIWLPLERLQQMTGMKEEATLVVLARKTPNPGVAAGWTFRSPEFLLQDLRDIVRSKTVSSSIMYAILLFLAMLAIFDTQVLSVWRRRKEMGTLMALGLTRGRVIGLFTVEGAMLGILAVIVGAIYGIPLLVLFATNGWALPKLTDSMGLAVGEKLFPRYGAALVLGTTLLVLIVTTIVSYLPTRRIAKLKPTDALRGRFT